MASVAARPGSSVLKSSTGSTSMKRRSSCGSGGLPLATTRQEKLAGRPSSASCTVSDAMAIGRARSSSSIWPYCTPTSPIDSARRAPLRLGSAASLSRRGLARTKPSVNPATSPVGKYITPFRSKKRPLCIWRTARIRSERDPSAWANRIEDCSTSSGVGASTTTRMSGCGKAFMNSNDRCVHRKLGEKRSLTSVSMAKWRVV